MSNASCERFMKTLKHEEIYANDYIDLEHLRSNIETVIEALQSPPSAFGAGLSTSGGFEFSAQPIADGKEWEGM